MKSKSSLLHALLLNAIFTVITVNSWAQQCPISFTSCPSDTVITNDGGDCSLSLFFDVSATSSCQIIDSGFTSDGEGGIENWDPSTTGTGTPIFAYYPPDSFTITGATGGIGNATANLCYTMGDCGGTIRLNWDARRTSGATFSGDHVFYGVNGVFTQLTTNIPVPQSGFLQIPLNGFDVFCMRVQSNNTGGRTILRVENFSVDNIQLVQISGPASESSPGAGDGDQVGAGVYDIAYVASICGRDEDTCSFSITVLDSPPSIDCPSNMTVNLDTADCSRVFCYNVTASDNCTNLDVIIPGHQFIGTHNGNSYFISAPGAGNRVSWLQANILAAQLGGHLVTIADAAENTFLATNIPFVLGFGDNQYWIGLRYSPSTDQFKWTTEEPFIYSNWGPGQPGNIAGDYVWFWDLFGGNWWDSPSLFFRRYIIEVEQGLLIRMLAGVPSGGVFPPGMTTNVYEVTDAAGQTASCSFTLTVIGSTSLACKNVNVSLDSLCQVEITAATLLAGNYNCYDVFEVTLTDKHKHPVPNPVTEAYIGQTLIGTVTDSTTGNSCWSFVTIEDKLAPEIICTIDTMSCAEFNLELDPAAVEDCSNYDVELLDEFIEVLHCDTDFVKKITRRWIARDVAGNTSDTCSQIIYISRIDLDSVVFPMDVRISCEEIILLDENGHPSPYETGRPTLNGEFIWPTEDFLCNYFVDYEDTDLGEIRCVRKIMRVWRVREWWCNREFVRMQTQFIEIYDDRGPDIIHAPYDFEATTSNRSCFANVRIPPIEAVDACHNVLRIDVEYPGGILKGLNGGIVQLPIGDNIIVYRLYDDCYNLTEHRILIRVSDRTEPVAICDRRTVVALNQAGFNWVPAEVFDDGSFDECHLHHFEVRRMDNNPCDTLLLDDWGPEVGFCCQDVGKTIMVAFKVIDASGNEGICMVTVEVQDKALPLITCPPDIRVDCRFDFDLNNLGNSFGRVVTEESDRRKIVIDSIYWHFIDGHPLDGIASDNCPPFVIEEVDLSNMNQCGMGFIIRKFIAIDPQGNRDSCYQFIFIDNHFPFTDINIVWPLDFDTSNLCDPRLLAPELLSPPFDRPTYYDDECSLIGVSYHDHVFTQTVPGDPCYKIFRVWKVIDWCQRDREGDFMIWIDTQIIKVTNLIDPVITIPCADTTICSYDVNCRPIPVNFRIAATDDCTATADLMYRYKIDLDSDGTFDIIHAAIGGNVATGTWPLGRHILKWEVEDRCGNTASCIMVVNLLNCKSPTAYCHRDVSTALIPMDFDSNGIPETKRVVVWASDIDAGSYHGCGYPVFLSFSADTADKSRTFTCDDIGPQDVELWVTDINGNTSFCRTSIIIWDNPNTDPQCPTNITSAIVEGFIATESQERVEKANVHLDATKIIATNYEGQFRFGPINTGGSYLLRPEKNDDWMNGVTTADIVKMQKHILGMELLTTPYRMIAADVNKSKNITAKDISDLRKLILGITTEIAGNTSWRFIDENFRFNNLDETLNENFPEEYSISHLVANMNINFIGVKVGDVNESAKTRGYNGHISSRNSANLELNISNESLQKDEIKEVVFVASNIESFEGMQFTFQFNTQDVEFLSFDGNNKLKIGNENISLHDVHNGRITFSWNGDGKNGEELFRIKFRAIRSTSLVNALIINSSITPAIAFNEHEETGIQLRFNGVIANEFIVLQNEPNPWKQQTTIGMMLPIKGEVSMKLYDLTGKVFYSENRILNKGYQEWNLDQTILPQAGVYYYQVDFESHTVTKKMVILE